MAPLRPEPRSVAVQDEGLTVLYDPVDCVADIVFVHGLQGHPRKTWACKADAEVGGGGSSTRKRSPFRGLKGLVSRKKGTSSDENRELGSDVFWPLDLLPADCPNARILTFGYESNISRWFEGPANQNTIFHHAKDLLYALEAQRLRCNGRGLIFVVHSLGGIIIKDVLRRSADEQVESLLDIFKSTKAVLFLGTPHRGSNMAETGKMLQRLAAASGFSTNSRNLNALQTKSTELEVVHEGFMKLYQRSPRPFEVSTFQEAQGLAGVTYLGLSEKVVDDVSSSFTGTERCQTINANHMSMCRYMTKTDNGYKKVVGEIQIYLATVEEEEEEEAMTKQAKAGIASSPTLSSTYSFNDRERNCIRLFNTSDIGEYKSILPRCEEGTCQWILSDPQYLCWYSEAKSSLLWISGHPGTGKTILSTYLLEYLSENKPPVVVQSTVCFFFCDEKIESQRDGKAILRSLIHQILTRHRKLIKHIKEAYNTQGARLIDNFSELWRIFKAITTDKGAGSISIIIDAIDECEENTRCRFLEHIATLLDELRSATGLANNSVKFLVTSRPLLSRQYPTSHLQIKDLERNTIQDLQLVIQRKIDGIAKRTNCRAEARKYLEEALYSKADRTFLWVSLVIKLLERTPFSTQGEFQHLVERLPTGLVATYERFLHDIPSDYQEAARTMLHFIAGSLRPLSLDEIRILFAVKDSHTTIKEVEEDSQPNIRETIETILGPFVRISENHVNFVHQSAKDFLHDLSKQSGHPLSTEYGIDPANGSEILAKSCMSYLSLEDFDKDMFTKKPEPAEGSPTSPKFEVSVTSGDEGLHSFWDTLDLSEDTFIRDPEVAEWELCKSIAQKHPAFDYAALHWANHFASCNTLCSHEMQQIALALSDNSNMFYSNWFRYYWRHCEVDMVLPTNFNPFIAGCFFGHLTTVKILMETGTPIDQGTSSRGLYWASWKGHDAVVAYLLSWQTLPNWKSGERQTPLTVAARFDHLEVVKLLLRVDGNILNEPGKGGRTALSTAAGNGHLAVVEHLLGHKNIEPDLPDDSQWTPIFWAVGGKYLDVVRKLAPDKRIDLNHVDNKDRSILSWAAATGEKEIVRFLLLQDGIDVEKRDCDGRTALSWAAENGHVDVVSDMRRNKGVDVSAKDNQGRNAISFAAASGHPKMVEYLIKYDPLGADEGDDNGWTPLSWALFKDSPGTVKALLLSDKVDANRKDKGGRTPLEWAKSYGYIEVVKLLEAATSSNS